MTGTSIELSEMDQYALRNIRCRVHELVSCRLFRDEDRKDLEQQLFLEYWKRAGRLNRERGTYKTFKAQGSEFPCAVVVVHSSHSFMHHRNLLYTAVTRAKESVILVGDTWGIENCVKKRQVDRRNTFLFFLLPQGASV
jgi:hypothetical protein